MGSRVEIFGLGLAFRPYIISSNFLGVFGVLLKVQKLSRFESFFLTQLYIHLNLKELNQDYGYLIKQVATIYIQCLFSTILFYLST